MQNPPHLFGSLAPDNRDDALQIVLNAERLDFTYASHNLKTTPVGEPGDQLVGAYGATFLGGRELLVHEARPADRELHVRRVRRQVAQASGAELRGVRAHAAGGPGVVISRAQCLA